MFINKCLPVTNSRDEIALRMLTLLFLSVLCLPIILASSSYYNSIPANVINQHNLDGSGGFAFQTVDGQARTESRNHDGSVKGSYTYTAPDGQKVVVNYIADEKGYRTDRMPQASQSSTSSYQQPQQYHQHYNQPAQYQQPQQYHQQYNQPAQYQQPQQYHQQYNQPAQYQPNNNYQDQYQSNNYYQDQYYQPAQPAPFTSFVVNHPAAKTVVTPYGYTLTSH